MDDSYHLLNKRIKMRNNFNEQSKLWSCMDRKTQHAQNAIIGHRILNSLIENGSKVAQINDDNGVQMTYYEIWLETVRVAQNLQKRGFKSRQVFGFMAASSDHLASIISASFCLACPIVPLHPMLSKKEIVRVFAKTKPSVIFCDSDVYHQLNAALKELNFDVKVFTIGEQIDGLEPIENLLVETGYEKNFVALSYNPEKDVGAIFCSSGTTGPSKLVCASYDADYLSQLIFPPDSVLLTFESIYWTSGINPIVSVMQNSSGIKRIITAKPFSPELQLKLIEKYKISALCNSPSKLIACVKNDDIKQMKLLSVKDIMLYGNKVPCNLVNEAIQYFPNAKFRSLYGMTEIGIISISTLDVHSPTNCGRLFPGKTAKIIDESGNRCGPDVSGEICVQQKHQFLGYLGDSKATAAVIDNEGFYRTGDRGHFDGNGRFWFQDRIKNIIRVYYFSAVLIPTEIEDFLLSIPDILDVCVVGIPAGVGTAIPAALVVKKTDSNLSHHDVFNTIAENFANYLKLRGGVYFVNSFPKTHSGKPIREEITKLAIELFKLRRDTEDPDDLFHLSDIPEAYRQFILCE